MAPLKPLYTRGQSAYGGEKTMKISLEDPRKMNNISSPKIERQVGRFLRRQAQRAAKDREELNASGFAGDLSALKDMQEAVARKELEALAAKKMKARCQMEQAKKPVPWPGISMDIVQNNHAKRAKGLFYGLEFPWSEQLIKEFGPEWLTLAMHTAGTLEQDNEVTEVITGGRKITAGNNGAKSLFEVRYKYDRPDQDTQLFAKLPYPMVPATSTDRISSSFRKQPMDWGEVNAYRLFEGNLPFKTPKYYFGDISAETSNFILLLGRIPFAEIKNGPSKKELKPFEVEGPYDKCKDYLLKAPAVEYYTVMVQKTAMLGGVYSAGKFASDDVLKGGVNIFGPESPHFASFAASQVQDAQKYKAQATTGYKFISSTASKLYPKFTQEKSFEKKYTRALMQLNAYAAELFIWKEGADCKYRGIGHQNLNMDNAYFWRDEAGNLDCGMLDWGGFGVNNMAHKLWWSFNTSDYELIRDHSDQLLKTFLKTYEEWGGPKVDFEEFKMAFMITALQNFVMMIGAVPNSLKMCKAKEFETITTFRDPRIAEDVDGKSTLRTTVWVINNVVRMIEEMNITDYLDRWVQEVYVGELGNKEIPDEVLLA